MSHNKKNSTTNYANTKEYNDYISKYSSSCGKLATQKTISDFGGI